ncbi:uncharacterized protein LY79DRAFT_105182 [Colletotrichum navitas]|uniref:Uncharacterized protein n=1 Tax=Colletotrichum navitas TaxID=681940 RepID=A0AAD8PK11_9PEZI|nr:uncharacterized protein LY79DRAFT_105182 [Colletotrichum navitas]KAK1566158.1 hypothetical protein LY79DRAFT_105182 [Colletotrichum navitas]
MKLSYVLTAVLAAAQVQATTIFCQCRTLNKHGRQVSWPSDTRETCRTHGGDMYNSAWCEVDMPNGRSWESWWSGSCDSFGHCEHSRPNV